MKSTMKFKVAAISIAIILGLVTISLFAITPSRSSATATITFPAGANKIVSKTFQAPRGANVMVYANMKNNGSICTDPAKRLTAKVYKPDGLLAIAKEECVIPGETKQVSFNGSFTGGPVCGDWKVEVTNPNDNATNATATITAGLISPPVPIVHTESQFDVRQRQTVVRTINIPQSGDLAISAAWNPANVLLQFKLKKGNSETIAGYASGLGAPSPQLKLNYRVTQQDIQTYGTSWKLEVIGSSQFDVQNVKPTKVLLPGCY
jgi:hypothetical protein